MKFTIATTAEIHPPRRSNRTSYQLIWMCLALQVILLGTASLAHATFPGRNGLIAFQAQTDAGLQIFTVRPNGHDLRQITHVDGDAVLPDWSPDGRQIVFEIDRPNPTVCSIAVMNADGNDIVELTPPNANICESDPSFTPDGLRIIFDRVDFDTQEEAFWSMNRAGGDRKRIGNCCSDPNVSPNGKKLSFLTNNGQPGQTALFTSGIDGSTLFQVTPFSFNVAVKQDWSPDGKTLLFTVNGDLLMPGVSANIATVHPDGTHLRFVTDYEGGDVSAFVGSYSPDGRWIVFRLNDHGSFGLFKIRPDGTHLTTILPLSSFRPRFIDWGSRPSEREDEEEDN